MVNEDLLYRFDTEINPNCRDCDENDETTQHALLECPALNSEREEICNYLTAHNLELNLRNLLGLNPKLNSSTQQIQRRLVDTSKKRS